MGRKRRLSRRYTGGPGIVIPHQFVSLPSACKRTVMSTHIAKAFKRLMLGVRVSREKKAIKDGRPLHPRQIPKVRS
jgi:hypothetical protein